MKKCISCGLCKPNCPIYKIILRESVSPRGKGLLKNNEILNSTFYLCTNCGLCTENCPTNFDLRVEDERAKLVRNGQATKINEKILINIKKYGNPFGKLFSKKPE